MQITIFCKNGEISQVFTDQPNNVNVKMVDLSLNNVNYNQAVKEYQSVRNKDYEIEVEE